MQSSAPPLPRTLQQAFRSSRDSLHRAPRRPSDSDTGSALRPEQSQTDANRGSPVSCQTPQDRVILQDSAEIIKKYIECSYLCDEALLRLFEHQNAKELVELYDKAWFLSKKMQEKWQSMQKAEN